MSPIIHEKPRLPIENTGEQHLACAVLIDTSASMTGYENDLMDAIKAMKDAIVNDDIARGRVEISVIAFDDDVREESPFGPIARMEAPRITCGGMTSTHAAIEFALERVNERKEEYKQNHLTYNQPWIWLLTDGGSNDADNGSFEKLLQAQREKKCTFFGVAIGDNVNETELGRMHKNGMILKVGKDDLGKVFEFISKSVTGASTSKPGEKVDLSLPSEIQAQYISIDA